LVEQNAAASDSMAGDTLRLTRLLDAFQVGHRPTGQSEEDGDNYAGTDRGAASVDDEQLKYYAPYLTEENPKSGSAQGHLDHGSSTEQGLADVELIPARRAESSQTDEFSEFDSEKPFR
jgi:hypothetical protein